MKTSRWCFNSIRSSLHSLERILFHPSIAKTREYFEDNQHTMSKLHRFVYTWNKFRDSRSSPKITDRCEIFEFWMPQFGSNKNQVSSRLEQRIEAAQFDEIFTLTESEEDMVSKIDNLLRRSGIPPAVLLEGSEKTQVSYRFHRLFPIVERGLEKLRKYGIFVGVQSEEGEVYSLSKTEEETLGIVQYDAAAFHKNRGFGKFCTHFFHEGDLIKLLDAIVELENLYKSWRGSVLRTGVTFIFTFCRRKFPKHCITLDGCIFISMDVILEFEEYLFSISGIAWSACQDCAQRLRHENANELVEYENRGKILAEKLEISRLQFVITPGTDPNLINDISAALHSSNHILHAAREKYPNLSDKSFKQHLQIHFTVFSRVDMEDQFFHIGDDGVLWISAKASVKQVLTIILRWGHNATERAIFHKKISDELTKLKDVNRKVTFHIANSLRESHSRKFLSCFNHFLQQLNSHPFKSKIMHNLMHGAKSMSVYVCEKGSKIKSCWDVVYIPWDANEIDLKNLKNEDPIE